MASGRTPSLQRYTEFDVLQRFHAILNSSITDPNIFAAHLIAEGFMSQQVADNKMPLGFSNFQKVGNLLGVVDSHIKSVRVVSYERVRDRFKAFLSILSYLDLGHVAREMEQLCYGTQSTQSQPLAASTRGSSQPQPQTTPAPQLQTYAPGAPRATVSQHAQKQTEAFSKDINNEQLALWLSHHPKLVGTDFSEDINKLRGAKINGHTFLNLTETRLERLDVSVGFSMLILDIIEELNAGHPQPPGSQNGSQISQPAVNTLATTNTPSVQSSVTSSLAGADIHSDSRSDGLSHKIASNQKLIMRPTLRELQLLQDCDGRQVRVIDSVAPHWKSLATSLGFDGARLQLIDMGAFCQPEDACRDMFIKWLNGERGLCTPITWATLIRCLQRVVQLGNLSETLTNCLCNLQGNN